MYVCMYVCMYVYMYVCMYVCMYVHMYQYVCTYEINVCDKEERDQKYNQESPQSCSRPSFVLLVF